MVFLLYHNIYIYIYILEERSSWSSCVFITKGFKQGDCSLQINLQDWATIQNCRLFAWMVWVWDINILETQCIPKSRYTSSTQCILNKCIFNLMCIPLNVLQCSYISFNSMRLELNVSLTQCIFETLPKAQRTQAWSPMTRLTTYVKSARFKHFDQNSQLLTWSFTLLYDGTTNTAGATVTIAYKISSSIPYFCQSLLSP